MDGGYQRVIDHYLSKKNALLEIYNEDNLLSEKSKKRTVKYINEFFETLEDAKKLKKYVYQACPIEHTHIYEY